MYLFHTGCMIGCKFYYENFEFCLRKYALFKVLIIKLMTVINPRETDT